MDVSVNCDDTSYHFDFANRKGKRRNFFKSNFLPLSTRILITALRFYAIFQKKQLINGSPFSTQKNNHSTQFHYAQHKTIPSQHKIKI
ncbi:hypothetical protein BpHYR1_013747 [Brachionus plicatilis]|uniref:Uncharacterized protein n=1 Tax=Brachionus plicatilis TaxID=10195 RepID=A0A3M7PAA0_BRAPC|nr:hypothetical protein BpHYR1_013747 [Brachionus plicatilis]